MNDFLLLFWFYFIFRFSDNLEKHFEKLGESCKKLLKLFYYQKASLKEIAASLNLTEKTAKNTKYRCMKSLRSNYKSEKVVDDQVSFALEQL